MEKLAALKAEAVSTGDSKRYDAAKKQLPLFCWSGQFDKSKGVPSSTSLLQHSGRLQIDIDGLESPVLICLFENTLHTLRLCTESR